MNSFVLLAEVIQAPQMRYTQDNQTAIAEMLVQFPGARDNDPPSQLKVTGWGNLAQRLQDQCQVGQQYVLEGRLQMNLVQRPEGFKEKLAELRLSRFSPLGDAGSVPVQSFAPAAGAPSPAAPTPAAPAATPAYANPTPAAPVTPTPPPATYDDIPF
ncbi:MAG: single-stranded DNA-binding protein [Prochlorothrix sp.]|nr:single-stranded DNA-binding protein [Prochlorothrix sp.]